MGQLRVREWRRRRALSQAELAQLAGLTKATVVALEKPDARTPYPRTVRKLAAALGVEPEDLYGADDEAPVQARREGER